MRRLAAALTAGTLALALLGLAPGSAGAEPCDPDHPFTLPGSPDLSVGIAGVEGLVLAVEGSYGCSPGVPYARVTTPRGAQLTVNLEDDADPGPGRFRYSAYHPVDPVLLRNPDAGTWRITYEVEGEVYGQTTVQVRRATRLSFDAGPEPVRRRTITFRGRLERADWEWRAWRSARREQVTVSGLGPTDSGTAVPVAVHRTSSHGRYRITTRFPGTDRYQATFAGTSDTAPSVSRVDAVRGAR